MRKLLTFAILLLAVTTVSAQSGGGYAPGPTPTLRYGASNPTGACMARAIHWQTTSNTPYICEAGSWVSMLSGSFSGFPLLATDGTIAAPSYSFASETDLGCHRNAANVLVCASGSAPPSLGYLRVSDTNVQLYWYNASSAIGGFTADTTSTRLFYSGSTTLAANSTAVTLQPGGQPVVTAYPTGSFTKNLNDSMLTVPDGLHPRYLINGGYTLANTTSVVADEIDVVVVDTTPTITDGDVRVCGYTTLSDQTNKVKTCQTLDISAGAGTYTTVTTYIEVTNVKVSSATVLGGGGDETLQADWDAATGTLFGPVNLVNDTKTGDGGGVEIDYRRNFTTMLCLDLQGCDVTLTNGESAASNGSEWLLYVMSSSTGITFIHSGGDLILAGAVNYVATVNDALRVIYTDDSSQFVEISRSVN